MEDDEEQLSGELEGHETESAIALPAKAATAPTMILDSISSDKDVRRSGQSG